MAANVEHNHALHEFESRFERRNFRNATVGVCHVGLRRLRHGQRDDAGRVIVFGEAYAMIRLGLVPLVLMNGRAVRVPLIAVMVANAMDMKGFCLRLEGANRQRDHGGEIPAHDASLWDTALSVNGRRRGLSRLAPEKSGPEGQPVHAVAYGRATYVLGSRICTCLCCRWPCSNQVSL